MANTYDDILAAAAECFKEQGFSATSIDDVARFLGATKGMIYHHFRSKNDLFFEVYRKGMEINFNAVQPHFDSQLPPTSKLTQMCLAHAITMMSEQAFQRTLGQGVAMHQTGSTTAAQRNTLVELIEHRNTYESLFRRAIEDAVKDTDTQLNDPSIATRNLLAVLNSTVYWYSPRDEDPSDEQLSIARELTSFALRGLGIPLKHISTEHNGAHP